MALERNKNVSYLFIDEKERIGQRIDNYLFRYFRNIPRKFIYKIIRSGEVRVNSCRINQRYRIKLKDLIRIPPIFFYKKNISINKKYNFSFLKERILFEDKNLLIINKPSGLAVHGGTNINIDLISALKNLRSDLKFLELVHRLDRETSGILLLAKNFRTLRFLHFQFRLNLIEKEYLALLKGKINKNQKIVRNLNDDNFVFKNGKLIRSKLVQKKSCKTEFKVEERFYNSTLVRASTNTGKTHQIRIHAKKINHPIALDKRYGDFKFNRKLILNGLNRLFLHANSISFFYSESFLDLKKIRFKIQLDVELNKFLRCLRCF